MIKYLISVLCFLVLSCSGSKTSGTEEDKAWEEVKSLNTLSVLDSFLIQFPDTKRKSEIAARREGIYYRTAVFENSEFFYNRYKKEFPQGKRIKEIESKQETLSNETVDFSLVENMTFVGSLQSDINKSQKEILTVIFKKIDDEKKFEANVFLTSDIKKLVKGSIETPGNYFIFEEDENSDFIIGLGKSRLYNRKNVFFLESVEVSDDHYWKVEMTETK